MRRGARVAAAVLAVLVLAGCTDSPDIEFPGKARIDVDTPQLRQEKKEAGVEPCEPGTGDNELPSVTLPCFGGGPDVDIAGLEGPLVVNVWAGWCVPCRQEMPTLQEFYEQYGDQVGVLGINVRDPQTESAMDLVQETGVTYPLIADPNDDLAGRDPFNLTLGIPSLIFVRADGSIQPVAGVIESVDELVGLVDTNLGIQL
jgi:thiol-disulfide isomerase/thioredoxin